MLRIISLKHKVVVFVRISDIEKIRPLLHPSIEIRVIDEARKSYKNKIWTLLYSRFGKIPKSVNNYHLQERFLIISQRNKYKRLKALFFQTVFIRLPKFISYDLYLNKLDSSKNTKIDDIDKFICLTKISDDYFFSRLLKEEKVVKVYVYSWDHPCKHKQFSNRVKYLVWNKGIKSDLISLHNISHNNITQVGSSQFCFVEEFFSKKRFSMKNPFRYDYIYFGCFAGIPEMVIQETNIIKKISLIMYKFKKNLKLVVKPYPILSDWSLYDRIENIPNIYLDKPSRSNNLSTSKHEIMEKFNKIYHAKAFFHLGTTMGLEACLTSTPSFLIDFGYDEKNKSIINVKNGIHQYQNEKYLINIKKPNVINSENKLMMILQNIDSDIYRKNNKSVSEKFSLISFEKFANKLIEVN